MQQRAEPGHRHGASPPIRGLGQHRRTEAERLDTAASALALPQVREVVSYVANIRRFDGNDWRSYLRWIGTIVSLLLGTTSFLAFGAAHGVRWPGYVLWIPIGTAMFCAALAVDEVGHRTLYRGELQRGEGYVHQMIIATAITSVMALCLGYFFPETLRMPAAGLIFLSLFYSALDEALHWVRYLRDGVDRVEMWSHFVAIVGHVVMIACWWQWYASGYPGVDETLGHLFG